MDTDLRARGSALVLRSGDSLPTLQALIEQAGAEAVYWNRRYEPATQPRDATIKRTLRASGASTRRAATAACCSNPGTLPPSRGQPYKVFTPYWRNVLSHWRLPALGTPKAMAAHAVDSLALEDLQLAPTLHWDAGFWEHWQPGEAGALDALSVFEDGALRGYREQRDLPDRVGTSRLSPHLHFGEIAPWRIAHALEGLRTAGTDADIDGYLRQLGWRDFAYHLLHHFRRHPPTTSTHGLTVSLGHAHCSAAAPLAARQHRRADRRRRPARAVAHRLHA